MRIFFLQKTRIRQQYPAKLVGSLSAIYFPVESCFHQSRNISAVINMRMGQDDGIDRRRIHRKRFPVPLAQILTP